MLSCTLAVGAAVEPLLPCSGSHTNPAEHVCHTAHLPLTVLPPLSSLAAGAWSLLDVCCMCASSKQLRSSWLQLLKQQPSPAWLVDAAADAAQASTPSLQAKATKVMRWLLRSLPEARLTEQPSALAGLLAIPRMPWKLAVELCGVGVRVPYADVVAAARRRVAGETSSGYCIVRTKQLWTCSCRLAMAQH
jgi:hypothetical protein